MHFSLVAQVTCIVCFAWSCVAIELIVLHSHLTFLLHKHPHRVATLQTCSTARMRLCQRKGVCLSLLASCMCCLCLKACLAPAELIMLCPPVQPALMYLMCAGLFLVLLQVGLEHCGLPIHCSSLCLCDCVVGLCSEGCAAL